MEAASESYSERRSASQIVYATRTCAYPGQSMAELIKDEHINQEVAAQPECVASPSRVALTCPIVSTASVPRLSQIISHAQVSPSSVASSVALAPQSSGREMKDFKWPRDGQERTGFTNLNKLDLVYVRHFVLNFAAKFMHWLYTFCNGSKYDFASLEVCQNPKEVLATLKPSQVALWVIHQDQEENFIQFLQTPTFVPPITTPVVFTWPLQARLDKCRTETNREDENEFVTSQSAQLFIQDLERLCKKYSFMSICTDSVNHLVRLKRNKLEMYPRHEMALDLLTVMARKICRLPERISTETLDSWMEPIDT
jgi:hypothetical protein